MTGAGGFEQQQQVAAWKAYLAWECSNPQRLAGPDLALRVNLAYDQALMPLRLYPDVRPAHSAYTSLVPGFTVRLLCRQQQPPALCVQALHVASAKSKRQCQLCRCDSGKQFQP